MPALNSPHPFYDWVSQVWGPEEKVSLTGTPVEWPETMIMAWDFL